MAKVLLQHAGNKPSKKCQQDLAKMVKVAIAVRSSGTPNIEMISVRELHLRETKEIQVKKSGK